MSASVRRLKRLPTEGSDRSRALLAGEAWLVVARHAHAGTLRSGARRRASPQCRPDGTTCVLAPLPQGSVVLFVARRTQAHRQAGLVGIIVGMAFVVSRRDGRFEIRESVHTAKGPRARTLANFSTLTEGVIRAAEARARRPFDRTSVVASAVKRGAPTATLEERAREGGNAEFASAARRFASSPSRDAEGPRVAAGDALIGLIGFAEEVARSQPKRDSGPLRYPILRVRAQ